MHAMHVPFLQVWDPVLITAQIVSVQCLFYISLGLIQAVTLGRCSFEGGERGPEVRSPGQIVQH